MLENRDFLKLFVTRLREIDVDTHLCKNVDELYDNLKGLVENVETPIPIVGNGTDYRRELIKKMLKDGLKFRIMVPDLLEPFSDIELSIGFPEYGLANTGTLVYKASSSIEEVSLYFPEKHISIISKDRIIYDLEDLEKLSVENILERGESLLLITGSSSTADIEGEIIRGVHGPRVLYVFVLEEAR
ncbi:MAG: LUD domain-containing protein [Nitrososphaerota archaeon]|nr:LUD domain-containing protein [Candidatus Geocrenenecus dongiae]